MFSRVGVVLALVLSLAAIKVVAPFLFGRDSSSSSAAPTPTADGAPFSSIPRLTPRSTDVAGTRKGEIFAQAADKLGDVELGREYQEINKQHFQGRLPTIPVNWEPRLAEVGPLTAPDFTVEGVNGRRILLNTSLQLDRARVRAVLCHEMVHVHFFATGDANAKHGQAFQGVLRRLFEEKAFEGLWASETEKIALRMWLDTESQMFNRETSELDRTRIQIDLELRDQHQEMDVLNARIAGANAKGDGWPSDEEIRSVKAGKDLLSQRLAEFNDRVERDNADAAILNRQAARYNLMMSYPDGLDEESLIRARSVFPSIQPSR